jgi:gliding motility-associated-like protein
VSADHPMHLIYRSSETSGFENLTLIDSVNVTENGFTYSDHGSFQNQGLNDQEYYCYRIKTRGTYGNPEIATPQENYSQLICSTTFDETPPCQPTLTQVNFDCDLFNSQTPCSQSTFSHTIQWEILDVECTRDIYFYKIYASKDVSDGFQEIGLAFTNEFTESGLTSLKRCYKITSVDRAGNESEVSDSVCFDNCPSISFPNVFTPNYDLLNEEFTNFDSDEVCLRFISSVSLSVFNRWGIKVIELNDQDKPIGWDGRDSRGNEVAAGIYYFKDDVVVDVLDSNNQLKELKGWIQVVR